MDGSQRTAFESKITIVNLTKLTEGVMAFNQGNVEALMKSGHVWAAGCQEISNTIAAVAQAQLDQTMSTWKALVDVRSLKEATDFRTSHPRASFEAALAEAGKITALSMRLAEATMAPIAERMVVAFENFKSPPNR
jgi:hypothetical protein